MGYKNNEQTRKLLGAKPAIKRIKSTKFILQNTVKSYILNKLFKIN